MITERWEWEKWEDHETYEFWEARSSIAANIHDNLVDHYPDTVRHIVKTIEHAPNWGQLKEAISWGINHAIEQQPLVVKAETKTGKTMLAVCAGETEEMAGKIYDWWILQEADVTLSFVGQSRKLTNPVVIKGHWDGEQAATFIDNFMEQL